MRNLTIKLISKDQLQELNSIVMSLVERCSFESDNLIDLLNLRDLLKKLADKIYHYANRLVKKITLQIEINQYRSLKKIVEAHKLFLREPALIYHRNLLNDVLAQGVKDFDKKYFFEINNSNNLYPQIT
jgi:hypothetical protein